MNVSLYNCTDDPRVVDKTLTSPISVTATPLQSCSIYTPRLILAYTDALKSVNYMYISDFNRFYFITNINVTPGGQIEITGSVDVLMSFRTAIRNCAATIVRSESIGAPTMIPDSKLPINPVKKELLTAVKNFRTKPGNMYLVRLRDSTYTYVEPSNGGD